MAKAKQGTTFDWSALIPKTFPVPLAELNPYENNPRINKRAIPYVKRSIKRFGFIVPIVIDSQTSRVIAAGHTRLAAALQLCEEEGKDPAKVKVLCLSAEHLTPSQVRQFRLADNRVASFSEDDAEKLKRELEDLMEDWDAGEQVLLQRQAGGERRRVRHIQKLREGTRPAHEAPQKMGEPHCAHRQIEQVAQF